MECQHDTLTANAILNEGEAWRLDKVDCIEATMDAIAGMPEESVDVSIYSPPFNATYAYSCDVADIGNSEDFRGDGKLHLSFMFNGLRRVLKPGRVMVVHCCQLPKMKKNDEVGLRDFRGLLIRLAERAGFVYEYDWIVRKNPQSQALRNHVLELQFAGLERDRARSRGCLGDYLLKFRAPGDNAVHVDSHGEVSRDNWIDWAECSWNDIQETDTLNVIEARSEEDTKHICPLQLEVIRRLILLYTNPGELVFSPFAGIGSEGYMALGGISPKTKKHIANPRRFYGCEIKFEYVEVARRNLAKAVEQSKAKENLLF